MATRIRFWMMLLLAMYLCQPAGEAQQGEAKLGIPITALPYTISGPGVYVLNQDFLNLNLTGASAAIKIEASDVVIDLNGHTISNTAAGAGTLAYGVYATDQSNITVRNGMLQGFMTGVALTTADYTSSPIASYGHLVEKLNVNACTYEGISLVANDSTVRSCQVNNIGGSSLLDELSSAYGIEFLGTGLRCLDNDVSQMTASGTDGLSYAIYLDNATDAFVLNNRMSAAQYGLYFGAASGQYRHNLATGMLLQGYVGGTDAGKNIVDSNNDGVDDDWEMQYFGTLNVNLYAQAPNGEGMTILQAYQQGLNPVDFYTAQTPILSILSGTPQSAAPGSFVPAPLVVQVVDANGNPITGAPVTFSIASGDGQLQASRQASPKPTLSMLTDANGQAKAFFQVSATAGVTSSINAVPTGTKPANPPSFQETADDDGAVNPTPVDPHSPPPAPEEVPVQSYASIDASSNVQGNNDVTMVALNDAGQVAFGYYTPPVYNSLLDYTYSDLHTFTWQNGVAGQEQVTLGLEAEDNVPDPSGGGQGNFTLWHERTPKRLLSSGAVYGDEDVGAIPDDPQYYGFALVSHLFYTQNGHASSLLVPSPFWGPSGYALGYLDFGSVTESGAIVGGGWAADYLAYYYYDNFWFIYQNNAWVVFDPFSLYPSTFQGVTLHQIDFIPTMVNGSGHAVGGDSTSVVITPSTAHAYYWDGAKAIPMPDGSPAGINDQDQAIVRGIPVEGYLWENGSQTILVNKLPAELAGKITNIQPTAISNQTAPGTDTTIYILATANVTQADGTVVNGATIVCTRDNDGDWSFAQVGVPDGTTVSQYTTINSSGNIAGIGSISTSGGTNAGSYTNGDPSPSPSLQKALELPKPNISLTFGYKTSSERGNIEALLRSISGLTASSTSPGDIHTFYYDGKGSDGKPKKWVVQTSTNQDSLLNALKTTPYVFFDGHGNDGAGFSLKKHASDPDFDPGTVHNTDGFMQLRNAQVAIPWKQFHDDATEYPNFGPDAVTAAQIVTQPRNYAVNISFSNPIRDGYGNVNPERYPNNPNASNTHVDAGQIFPAPVGEGIEKHHMTRTIPPNSEFAQPGNFDFLVVRVKQMARPHFGYKTFCAYVCNGARDYGQVFNHGRFISTTKYSEPDEFVAFTFVETLVGGLGSNGLISAFEGIGNEDFTQADYQH